MLLCGAKLSGCVYTWHRVLFMTSAGVVSFILVVFLFGQARGLDANVTLIVGDDPQPEFMRSTRNIVGVKVLAARVRIQPLHVPLYSCTQYPFVVDYTVDTCVILGMYSSPVFMSILSFSAVHRSINFNDCLVVF